MFLVGKRDVALIAIITIGGKKEKKRRYCKAIYLG
jgi:hypothetical protein